MKHFRTDAFIFLVLLILASAVSVLIVGQNTLDIQFHDTYVVLDKFALTILILGALMFLIFLVRAWTRKFNAVGVNIGLSLGLVFVALFTYGILRLQQEHLSIATGYRMDGSGFRQASISQLVKAIGWTWGLLACWIVALVLVAFRTVKIWRNGNKGSNT